MKLNELFSYIDTFEKGKGHYTKPEMFSICCAYKAMPFSEKAQFPWESLIAYCGFTTDYGTLYTPNGLRKWVINRDRKLNLGIKIIDEERRTSEIILNENRQILNKYRAQIREQSKIKYLRDGLIQAIRDMDPLPRIYRKGYARRVGGNHEAVLMISDWHIGMLCDHEQNKFNFAIAQERIARLLEDTKSYIRQYHITKLHVLNLGDLIHGKIHRESQVSQEFDVPDQIMRATELMSQLLLFLSREVNTIIYHSVVDNHSALESNKANRNSKENLSRLIDMLVKERLKQRRILFPESSFNCSISKFTLQNTKVCGAVHGDKDTTQSMFQNMVGALQKFVHYIFSSHVHHFSTRDFQKCMIFINSSLCGPDDHSVDLRKFSHAGQKLVIFDHQNIVDINIILDTETRRVNKVKPKRAHKEIRNPSHYFGINAPRVKDIIKRRSLK